MSIKSEIEGGFLARWSRRKIEHEAPSLQGEPKADPENAGTDITVESQDEAVLPLWQQKEINPENQQKAMAALFRQPEFKEVDHMNEYDEDFTHFDPLGDVITREMKRMLKLAEEKTRPQIETGDRNLSVVTESEEPATIKQQDKEDNELA